MAVVNNLNLYELYDVRRNLWTVGPNKKLTPAEYKLQLDILYQWYHVFHGFINPFTKSLEAKFVEKKQSQILRCLNILELQHIINILKTIDMSW